MTSRVGWTLEHRINFGDYEGVTTTISIQRDCDEGQEQKTLGKIQDVAANQMDDHIKEARRFATATSYIHEWEG
jgi:hypothetical protein